jgi:thiamine biosynthesis protein ThiI|tara:strand:+ start:283 stop:948 length:666 start_codon:yes stop_codon:yes gene_type:complete
MAGVCVALVSGGIDSPVAVARMLMQGWKIFPVHASQEPVTGPESEEKTIALLRHLLESDGPLGDSARENLSRELIVVPVAEKLALFTEKWNHTEYFIHMKRLYNSIATIRGKEVDATHLLTGENLGQVSSQTLGNLGGVEIVTNLLPLRPLLAFDKVSIMTMARNIGTLEISEGPEVCDALGPSKPTTVANKEWLERSEERAGGLQHLASDCFSNSRIVKL